MKIFFLKLYLRCLYYLALFVELVDVLLRIVTLNLIHVGWHMAFLCWITTRKINMRVGRQVNPPLYGSPK